MNDSLASKLQPEEAEVLHRFAKGSISAVRDEMLSNDDLQEWGMLLCTALIVVVSEAEAAMRPVKPADSATPSPDDEMAEVNENDSAREVALLSES